MGKILNVKSAWVVTGANSGIGYELACRLHRAGKFLVLVDKEIGNLTGFGGQKVIKCDLSKREELESLARDVQLLNPSVLINNAGVGFKGDFAAADLSRDLLTINVDVVAPIILTKSLLPAIVKNNGVIVNVTSSVANTPLPGMAIYAASKSFLFQWSAALWLEMRGKCDVITFSPSGTSTGFQKNAGVKESEKLLNAESVALEIYNAIENRTPFVFLGWKSKLVSYIMQFFPRRIQVMIWGMLFKGMR